MSCHIEDQMYGKRKKEEKEKKEGKNKQEK